MKVLKEQHLRYKKEKKYRFLVFFIALIFLFPFKLVQSETYYSPKLRSEYYKDEIKPYPHSRSLRKIENLAELRGGQSGLVKAEAFEVIRKIYR